MQAGDAALVYKIKLGVIKRLSDDPKAEYILA